MRNELIFSTLVLGLLVALPISAADAPVARVPVTSCRLRSARPAGRDPRRGKPANQSEFGLGAKSETGQGALGRCIDHSLRIGGAACVTRNNYIADRTTHGGRLRGTSAYAGRPRLRLLAGAARFARAVARQHSVQRKGTRAACLSGPSRTQQSRGR